MNVSVSAGIALFEAARQRRAGGFGGIRSAEWVRWAASRQRTQGAFVLISKYGRDRGRSLGAIQRGQAASAVFRQALR